MNAEWRPGLAATGGGQPIAPNCAVDAPSGQRVASTPQSGKSSQPSQPQSGGSTGGDSASSGGSSNGGSNPSGQLTWAAVPRANNYYLEVRDTTSQRNKVYGKMVPPTAGGCANGQRTCSHAVPSLPGGKSYQWKVRAVVNGKPQSFTAWQPVGSSSSASSGSGTSGNSSKQQASAGGSGSKQQASSKGGSAKLTWSATPRANNYYVEVRDTTSQRSKVYGKMVPPPAGGCVGGGTCTHVVSSLPGGASYQWTYRPVVNGKPQSFAGWRPVP